MIRVLYAEDDLLVAETVQLCFAARAPECELSIVHTGRDCLTAMERGGYDLLMVDLVLPDIDGLQVLGELTARRDPTPVVMVSGMGQHELAVRALRAGAVDCIDKSSSDFLGITDFVRRVHERHRRRTPSAPAVVPPRDYRILYLDLDTAQRAKVEIFFAASAPHLRLTAAAPERLAEFLSATPPIDAIVLGPYLAIDAMLDLLRHLRSHTDDLPAIVVSASTDREPAIAAFKLGAQDYLVQREDVLPELVFSLNNTLKRADTERLNARLTNELAALNQSLADQVADRTRDLEAQILVRKAAEQRAEDNASRLQALSTQLLRVQEDERRALARELHDQVGQLLTGLRFQLEAARTPGSSPALGEALALTDELLGSIRALTLQLRPRMLDDLGLQPALEWHTKLFGRQTGVEVDLEISLPSERLAVEMETAVYRFVQEALTNVARHSGSGAAVVTVTADLTSLHAEVADRGRGFDVEAALARRDSLGLAGLAERIRLAGGKFEVVSKVGRGTRLHAEFSLPPSPAPVA